MDTQRTPAIIRVFFFTWMLASLPFAVGDDLYLLTGSPTPRSSEKFASRLYVVEAASKSVKLIRDIMPVTEYILQDDLSRTLILADLNLVKSRIELVSEDQPDVRISVEPPINRAGWSAGRLNLLHPPSGGSYLAIDLVSSYLKSKTEHELVGTRLDPNSYRVTPLSYDLLGSAVANGKSGLVDIGTHDSLSAFSGRNHDGWLEVLIGGRFVNLDDLAPESLRHQQRPMILWGVNQWLIAATTQTIVEGQYKMDSGVWILSRATHRWTRLETAWPVDSIRSFGPWIAITQSQPEAAPSRKGRQRSSDMGPALSVRMFERHVSLPGRVILYEAQTGRQIKLDTGEEDTEVLNISNGVVYYRLGEKLLRSAILDKSLAEPEELASHAIVGDVHWIFWGPASMNDR